MKQTRVILPITQYQRIKKHNTNFNWDALQKMLDNLWENVDESS